MRRALLAALIVLAVAPPAADARKLVDLPVGATPLSDARAAALVKRSSWEPRPGNRRANDTVPTAAQLRLFRRRSDMVNRKWVTGGFTGTTDEILQWGARKWGFAPDLLRAVAVTESWWKASTVSDEGDSFGLMQMRRPHHCCLPFMRDASAFNVDYYGGILRALYDGEQTWLNEVARGRRYRAGDVWGSVGAWYAGRWRLPRSLSYVRQVKRHLLERTWRTADFRG